MRPIFVSFWLVPKDTQSVSGRRSYHRHLTGEEDLALMQSLVAQAQDGLVGRVTPADPTQQMAGETLPTPYIPHNAAGQQPQPLWQPERRACQQVTRFDWAANISCRKQWIALIQRRTGYTPYYGPQVCAKITARVSRTC